jgi:hypothetical protein
MFCPKCATQNVDGASFCRSCGANISLIPHALSGQLPTAEPEEDWHSRKWRRKRRREPAIDEAVRYLMAGVAFVVVSLLVGKYSPGGWTWWYWLLIPASTFFGRGISEIIRLKQAKAASLPMAPPQIGTASRIENLPASRTAELMPTPVPSVTEGTTRHLGVETPTRHFESTEPQRRSEN